jgi:hypothetical protein
MGDMRVSCAGFYMFHASSAYLAFFAWTLMTVKTESNGRRTTSAFATAENLAQQRA